MVPRVSLELCGLCIVPLLVMMLHGRLKIKYRDSAVLEEDNYFR